MAKHPPKRNSLKFTKIIQNRSFGFVLPGTSDPWFWTHPLHGSQRGTPLHGQRCHSGKKLPTKTAVRDIPPKASWEFWVRLCTSNLFVSARQTCSFVHVESLCFVSPMSCPSLARVISPESSRQSLAVEGGISPVLEAWPPPATMQPHPKTESVSRVR